jgi:two-component system, NarL family, response regulator NreC
MKTRILIVDDHKIFREGLISMLEKKPDIEIIGQAENGQEAIRLFQELHPDIVIMDIVMPDMNGIEATRQISDNTSNAKVIGLSMHEDGRFAAEMLKAGACGFLLKDCAFEELVDAINTVKANGIYLSAKIKERMLEDYVGFLSKDNPSLFSVLSAREQEVLKCLAEGKSTKEIAAQLGVSTKTIEAHRQNIMGKLNISNIADLIKYAIRAGLTSL